MEYVHLECPEGQVITLPPDGIISDEGILLSENDVTSGNQNPIQMLPNSSLLVPLLLKTVQGQTYFISRQIMGEGDDEETHYILASGMETEAGERVDGEMTNVDMSNIDYSLIDQSNVVFSEGTSGTEPREVDSCSASNFVDVCQLNLVHGSDMMHFISNADTNVAKTPREIPMSRQGNSLLKPLNPEISKGQGTSKDQIKRGRGRPKKEDADDIMEPPIGKGPYRCDQCEAEFDQWTQVKRHKRIHLNEKPFRCKQCYASFNIESNLVLHVATHNLDNLQCPECYRRFTRVASLRSHLMLHEQEDNLICSECGEEFNLLAHLHSHMQKHEEEWVEKNVEKVYDCPQCRRNFNRASALKDHLKEHLRVKTSLQHRKHKRHFDRSDFLHKCDTCHKQFQKPSQLLRHSRIHTGEKPFECEVCSRAFNQKGSLQVHMAKHNGSKPYACDFCNARFSQKGNRRAHIQRVHSIPQSDAVAYRCSECSCIFRKLGSLNSHMGRAHSRSDSAVKEEGSGTQVNVDQLVDDLVALEKAVKRESGNRDILQQAINKSGLEGKTEVSAKRSGTESKDSPVTGFITLADKAIDGTVRRYTIRQRKVGGVRWHQCSFCHKEFKKPSDLVRHIRTHTHEKPFKCHFCFRAFSVKSTLTAHQRTHQAVEKISCTVCSKQFSSSSTLKVHMRLHNGDAYLCQTCNTSFPSSALLQEHWATVCDGGDQLAERRKNSILQRIKRKKLSNIATDPSLPEIILMEPIVITDAGWSAHVPKGKMAGDPLERPYRCDRCGASFRKSSHLKMHLRMHSGERPFKCPVCDRSYISSTVLKAHMKTHENVKSFHCQLCFNAFSTNGSLKRHMLTHNDSQMYMCPYCKKRFKNVSNCKKHIKIHKPEIAMQVAQHLSTVEITAQRVVVSAVPDNDDFCVADGSTIDFSVLAENTTGNNETVEATQQVAQSLAEDEGTENMANTILEAPTITISDARSLSGEDIPEFSQQLEIGEGAHNGNLVVTNIPPFTLALPDGSKPDAITSLAVISTQLPVSIDGKDGTDLSSVIFGQAFDEQNFEGCTFSTIPIQGDPLEQTEGIDASELVHTDGLPTVVDENPVIKIGVSDEGVAENQRNSGLQKCNFCDETFHRMPELRAHMISHKKFPCSQCDRILSTASALKLHMKAHGKVKTFVCEQCNTSFSSHQALVKHGVLHSDDSKVFTCEKCAEQVPSMNQLRQHQKMHDRENGVVSPKKKNKSSQIQVSVEETMALATRDKESTLSVSEQVLIASAAERNRISELKDPSKAVECGPMHPNKCEFCPKSFRKPSDLVRHVRIHTGERPYRCDFCERTFTVKSTLDSHYKTHLKGQIKLFPCHVCNLRFATKGSLKVHMRIHTGAKPFKCPVCGQQFRTSGHRKAHIEMHERSANGIKVRSRKPRPLRVIRPEINDEEKPQANAEEITAIESVQHDDSLVELVPEENVVAFDLQEIINAGDNEFQWQLTDSDGVPLDPGSLTQDILQQLQEQLQSKRMVVQNNGTVELISMEDDQQIEPLDQVSDENIIVTNDAVGEAEEVTLHSIKDQEVFPMIEIASGDQTHHGAEMIGMPFEIHTDEHGEVVNIQQALENNGVLFSDIDIDMDTDPKTNLAALSQGQKLQVIRNAKFAQTKNIVVQSFDVVDAPENSVAKTAPNQKKRTKGAKNGKPNAYQCPDTQCSKVFSKPSQLQRHFRIHTGERPFQCNFCLKSFNQKNALMIHLKHHTGERPWPCPHCSHRFSQRGNLKTHLKRAHPFAPHKSQEHEHSLVVSQVPQTSTNKTKSHKATKLSLLDDDDIVKLGLSFFNR